jgi:hypothetical protein
MPVVSPAAVRPVASSLLGGRGGGGSKSAPPTEGNTPFVCNMSMPFSPGLATLKVPGYVPSGRPPKCTSGLTPLLPVQLSASLPLTPPSWEGRLVVEARVITLLGIYGQGLSVLEPFRLRRCDQKLGPIRCRILTEGTRWTVTEGAYVLQSPLVGSS